MLINDAETVNISALQSIKITKKHGFKNYVLHKGLCGFLRIDKLYLRIDAETVHEPFELFVSYGSGFIAGTRPCESTIFHSFDKEQESVTLPDEPFDLIGTPATEKKKGSGNKQR